MKKILIIDDEPNIVEILRLFTARMGYDSDCVHSGRAGIEKIKMNQYWTLFCDLQLPGFNGLSVYEHVKELCADLSKKFVLLTGTVPDQDTEAMLAAQKIKVLLKPFYFEDIRKMLDELETEQLDFREQGPKSLYEHVVLSGTALKPELATCCGGRS